MKTRYCLITGFVALLVTGSCVLYQDAPVSFRTCEWTHTVLRNWQEYGFFELHGKLASNNAGAGLPQTPELYPGHRPLSLYPAYWATAVFGCQDPLPFHLLFALAIGLAIWHLLGRGVIGMIAAMLTVFAPGYLRNVMLLDPLDVPVLFGIPFLYSIRGFLLREKLKPGELALILVLVGVYAPLNWTTVLSLWIVTVYLVAGMPGKLKRAVLFALFCGVAGGLVLVISLLSKAGDSQHAASSQQFLHWYNHYLFGPGGYDGSNNMTWMKAGTRLMAVSAVSLFPLWCLLCWAIWQALDRGGRRALFLLRPLWPLLAALVSVAGLRNYFAHHPWMASPVLIVGIVFSLRLLLDQIPSREGIAAGNAPTRRGLALCLTAGLSFAYAFTLLLVLQVDAGPMETLVRLARGNTSRHDAIYFSPQTDPWLAQNVLRLGGMMDRQLLPLPNPGDAPPESGTAARHGFLLTSQPPTQTHPCLASTLLRQSPVQQTVARAFDWYRDHMSKRAKGDRMEFGHVLYLYREP